MEKTELVKHIDGLRKANKDHWYFFQEVINGKTVRIKGFNTYLQILNLDGISYPTTCDIPVSKFRSELLAFASDI